MVFIFNKLKLSSANFFVLFIVVFTISGCNDQKNDNEWVLSEIINQIQDIKSEVKKLREDLAALNAALESSNKLKKSLNENIPAFVEIGKSTLIAGSPNAKTVILEFTDYECPYCVRHAKTVFPQIKKDLVDTGADLQYRTINTPLPFHKNAKAAAVAFLCANEQGKALEMHQYLFGDKNAISGLKKMEEKSIIVDGIALKECLKNKTDYFSKSVDESIDFARSLGVTGTPTFYIGKLVNNKIENIVRIGGAQPFDVFLKTVREFDNDK